MNKFKRTQILVSLFGSMAIISFCGFFALGTNWIYLIGVLLFFVGCLAVMAINDVSQTRHSLLRNYPLIGRLRWIMEGERSKIQQYFVEDETNGAPINKQKRSDIIQKAKNVLNTTPFGTMLNVYQVGYEFIRHSMYPKDPAQVEDLRVKIGQWPNQYSASILNISAMSYGALSGKAIHALNKAAARGKFFHNTGEGGISPFHTAENGDLCFQIGTGYFGCGKTVNNKREFDEAQFLHSVSYESVKLIELKLSQGAKPGHGGMLPASKNTPTIAAIRGIEPNVDVLSPPYHSAFSNRLEMLHFISKLKKLSNKPVGIKLCLGDIEEFDALVRLMPSICIPDFITVDGGEGGTGSAPLVFTNNVGSPLVDSLIEVNKILKKHGVRDRTKIIASGKITGSFEVIKMIALGADLVNSARAFMISIGCIQARECNNNTCPVGVATQNEELTQGLDVEEKSMRAFNYHNNLLKEVKDVMASIGVTSLSKLKPSHISYRAENGTIKTY